MKRVFLVLVLAFLAGSVSAYPDKPVLGWSQTQWGWSESEGKSRPFGVTATGAAIISTEGTTGITVATMPAVTVVSSGSSDIVLASETIGLMTRLAAILSSLASDAIGLKANSTISTFTAAIPAGTNTIGSIGAIVNALPAGTNAIGSVTVVALPETPAGTQTIGSVGAIINALPAGTNTIGSITVITLPALPAGTNQIGSIGAIVGALPAGSNAIGAVNATITSPIPAGTNTIGSVTVITLPATPAGTNEIGSVSLTLSPVASQTIATLTAAVYTIPPLANRRSILLWASGTFEFRIGSTTIEVNTPAVYNAGPFDVDDSVPVAVQTSATSTVVGILQEGN